MGRIGVDHDHLGVNGCRGRAIADRIAGTVDHRGLQGVGTVSQRGGCGAVPGPAPDAIDQLGLGITAVDHLARSVLEHQGHPVTIVGEGGHRTLEGQCVVLGVEVGIARAGVIRNGHDIGPGGHVGVGFSAVTRAAVVHFERRAGKRLGLVASRIGSRHQGRIGGIGQRIRDRNGEHPVGVGLAGVGLAIDLD